MLNILNPLASKNALSEVDPTSNSWLQVWDSLMAPNHRSSLDRSVPYLSCLWLININFLIKQLPSIILDMVCPIWNFWLRVWDSLVITMTIFILLLCENTVTRETSYLQAFVRFVAWRLSVHSRSETRFTSVDLLIMKIK